jgi:hypothetical protein
MEWITEFLIVEGGLSEDYLILLIGLPFIATLIGFARYYIGIKTFSLYSPIILTVAYYISKVNYGMGVEGVTDTERITAGFIIGLLFTVLILAVTMMTYRLLKKARMQFFPKISLGLSVITIVIIFSIYLFNYYELLRAQDINIISLILIALVSEQFLNTYIKKKFKTSIKLSVETILLSLICYTLLVIPIIRDLLITNPEIILLTLPINYVIGKFKGLRFTEYLRFKDILSMEKSPDESN